MNILLSLVRLPVEVVVSLLEFVIVVLVLVVFGGERAIFVLVVVVLLLVVVATESSVDAHLEARTVAGPGI